MTHIGTQEIVTERLLLRKYAITYAENMFRNWVANREVSKFWVWEPRKNINETRTLLQELIDDYVNEEYYHWVILFKDKQEAIGYIFLNEINYCVSAI